MDKGFICSCCGEFHNEIPMSYANPAPAYYYGVPQNERDKRIQLTEDFCVIDDKNYFIRGCIEIPIIGTDELFVWGVWCSLSETNFYKVVDYYQFEENTEELEPMFGWLSTSISCYPDVINLKTMVHHRPDNLRPYIDVETSEHPLSIEQRNGITMERVIEIAEFFCKQNKSMNIEEISFDREDYIDLLNTNSTDNMTNFLLGLTFHDDDWKYVQDLCISYCSHENWNVRGIAIFCFGHLARIHGELELDKVLPIVQKALNDSNEFVKGHATSALNDINFFISKNEF